MKILKMGLLCLYLMYVTTIFVLLIVLQHKIDNHLLFSILVTGFLISIVCNKKTISSEIGSLALFFTVFADCFLTLSEFYNQLNGLIFFTIVGFLYIIIVAIDSKKMTNIISITVRIILSSTIIILSSFIEILNLENTIAVVYFTNCSITCILSLFTKKKNICLIVGLFLFLLCDFFVGVSGSNISFGILTKLTDTVFISWIFYLPSQVVLAINNIDITFNIKKKFKKELK
ncbi:MAG: lysoplasmalogenase family protein [Acholeplasmatales bacterium]|jgi:hypothetical protein|nr:lysoplasmalogenase family protein [Acholeplasmatales bacterium]